MEEQVKAILKRYVADGHNTKDKLLGAAFVVTTSDGITCSASAGRTGLEPGSPDFAAESFTWMASMTKIITATCIMMLVERGTLALDEDVRRRVPELGRMQILRGFDADDKPVLEDNVRPITTRILLTHTLGLAYDLADPDLQKWSAAVGRTGNNLQWSLVGFNTPLKFAPGDGWCYGAALDWAGQLLERLTGDTLGAFMHDRVFTPLGMCSTGFWPEKLPQAQARAVSWALRVDGGALGETPPFVPKEHEMESGGAGLYSTAGDYALFFKGLLGGKLVSEETLREMFRPQLTELQRGELQNTMVSSPSAKYGFVPEFPTGIALDHGLGGILNMEDVSGKRRQGSMMWNGMANSRWWIDRQAGIGAALIVNVSPYGDPVVAALYDELERAVYENLLS